ncbi:hypothetical protein OVA26_15990 [Microbacterium sp. SL62]|uniref:hypothetical protein n=1 Tax=Microbacterium sp. SL62 TaxID=2995139 RepID=UPI0022770709|nr:hypothetical protein [Microbacterium sp. SL62]MCY1718436.1 hypothetical protein [Microbacterium sp. SL62]
MTIALDRTAATTSAVRPLLSRGMWHDVPTSVLAAFLSVQIVREQVKHCVQDTVVWTLAMFDVTPTGGGVAPRSIEQIGEGIEEAIEQRFEDEDITLVDAITIVTHALTSIYSQRVRVTGWLPGHRVAEGRTALELSGEPCPRCTVNPTAYVVGSRQNNTRCLNSEDCGWTSS